MKNSYLAEFLGTFFLVSAIGYTGDPLAIGSMLMVMVYAFGHTSGAHFNPAVTFAIWLRKKIEMTDALYYVTAQLLGAVCAALVIWLITDQTMQVGPMAGAENFKVMLVEVIFTFALATVILNVATHPRQSGNQFTGIAIGFTILAGAYCVGSYSGGVFNPAVATGPMLVDLIDGGNSINNIWIYLAANLLGGGLAAAVFAYMYPEA